MAPGARFAGKEDGRAQGSEPRELPTNPCHRLARAGDPPLEIGQCRGGLGVAQGAMNEFDEIFDIEIERADEFVGARLEGLGGRLHRAVAAEHDHRGFRAVADSAEEFDAITAGHRHVRDDEIRVVRAKAVPAFLPVRRRNDRETRFFEFIDQESARLDLVVYDENQSRHEILFSVSPSRVRAASVGGGPRFVHSVRFRSQVSGRVRGAKGSGRRNSPRRRSAEPAWQAVIPRIPAEFRRHRRPLPGGPPGTRLARGGTQRTSRGNLTDRQKLRKYADRVSREGPRP